MDRSIKMSETRRFSPDGVSVFVAEKGETYPEGIFPDYLLSQFRSEGACSIVDGKEPQGPGEMSASDVKSMVESIQDIDELESIMAIETSGKNRVTVVDAIQARIDELEPDEPESDEPEDKQG